MKPQTAFLGCCEGGLNKTFAHGGNEIVVERKKKLLIHRELVSSTDHPLLGHCVPPALKKFLMTSVLM